MMTQRKGSHVEVFTGSPWEAASLKSLLNAAYIDVMMRDNGLNSILLSVPREKYSVAVRIIEERKGS